jgi:hypothetical protein
MIIINDIRNIKDFKNITFSNYKKSKVNSEIMKSLEESNSEKVFYWVAELICSGHYIDLWENIILFMSKFIHIGNPKLPIYINKRIDEFKNIINNSDDELLLRNNMNIRNLFFEVVSILIVSNKKFNFYDIKIKDTDFNINHLSNKLLAPNTNYCKGIFKEKDSIEIFIPINELCYNLSDDSKKTYNALYWLNWIEKYEKKFKKKDLIEERDVKDIHKKYLKNYVWLIWECIFYYSNIKSEIIKSIINSLYNIYRLKFSTKTKNKRIYTIYYAIYFLTENYDINTDIINNKGFVDSMLNNIELVFEQVKINEIKKETHYLYKNIDINLD